MYARRISRHMENDGEENKSKISFDVITVLLLYFDEKQRTLQICFISVGVCAILINIAVAAGSTTRSGNPFFVQKCFTRIGGEIISSSI
jgi:hypothetical protein